jgi:cytochrome P450
MDQSGEAPLYWDPYHPGHLADPHTIFRRLREEAPAYYNEDYDFYVLSRYDDVDRALRDSDSFISGRGDILEFIKSGAEMPPGFFIGSDPPIHTFYRSALTRVFTPKRMTALEPQIRAFCAAALDPLVEGGEFDFIEDLGKEMPMRVIGMMLGIPDADLKSVQNQVDSHLNTTPGQPMDMETFEFVVQGFEEYIDWRIKHPSDDLMTEFLNVEFTDETGTVRRFRRDEVLVMSNLLAGAGNETTNRLIGWLGKVLADHPDQRRRIRENRALIPKTVEETLRFEPTGMSVARYIAKDSEYNGVRLKAGSSLCILVGAANRDFRKFDNPDAFDISRELIPHLTFGTGLHICLGNALARVEARVALDEILNRFPNWEVDLSRAKMSITSTVRGYESLPAYAGR